ncbi:hypothetical protein JRO89_XS01G0228700 [Xanthoceras sorbifolium]|uniref:C3H1-type domain-containing protein n=1 Tax=Xanthoceras sorbifolium TaxID=99658 RepID=A0ABQ8ILE8_9ROSI|nr:hypothetical protein JRO89_XS01G0228700 [Xanthoceras sorbifolium]
MGTCDSGPCCCWSPKYQTQTQSQKQQLPTNVSVTVTEPEKEQEQTLIEGFEKKVALNENDNICKESCNLEGDSNNSNGTNTKYEYPLRPYAEDCPYYLRTGYCNFGFQCKFNHPVRKGFQGVKEKEKGGFSEQPGQIQCKFYLNSGGCKYGVTCRFNHSIENSDIPPTELSAFSLPIQLEKENKSDSSAEKTQQIECKKGKNEEWFVHAKKFFDIVKVEVTDFKESHSTKEAYSSLSHAEDYKLRLSATYHDVHLCHMNLVSIKFASGLSKGVIKVSWSHFAYYLSAGGCKYGNTCKFSHFNEKSCRYVKKSEIAPPKLNFLGLPIRMLEKECPFYMRNGSCKYGVDCRFNHPEPVAAGGSDSLNSTTTGVSLGGYSSENCDGESDPLQLIATSQPAMESWTSKMTSDRTVPYLDNHLSHAPGMHLNSNSTRHEGSNFPNTKFWLPHSVPTVNNLMKTTNVSTYHQQEVDEFPERPGQPECDYFMKTGKCRYKSACKFHHPKSRASKLSVCISKTGLPLRPDKKICWNYERYGICKYGQGCLFDHPENNLSSASASGCNTATVA